MTPPSSSTDGGSGAAASRCPFDAHPAAYKPGPLSCPSVLLTAWQLGDPLDATWSALECAWRQEAPLQAVIDAIQQVLSPEGASQREVLRQLHGQGIPVKAIKEALAVGVLTARFTRTPGPRRAHLYRRSQGS